MDRNKLFISLITSNFVIILFSLSPLSSIISLVFSLLFLIVDFILIIYFIKLRGQKLAKYVFTFGLIYLMITIFYKPLAVYLNDIWNIDNADVGIYPTYQHQIIGTILSWMRVLIPLNAFVISRINK